MHTKDPIDRFENNDTLNVFNYMIVYVPHLLGLGFPTQNKTR